MKHRILLAILILSIVPTTGRGQNFDPHAENAALYYYRAYCHLSEIDDDKFDVRLSNIVGKNGPISSGDIDGFEDALKEMRRGARCSRCYWGSRGEGLEAVYSSRPDLSLARRLARIGCARALYYAQNDQSDEALADLEALMKFGAHLSEGGVMIDYLVMLVVQGMTMDAASKVAAHLDEEHRRRLAGMIENDFPIPSLRDVMERESELSFLYVKHVADSREDWNEFIDSLSVLHDLDENVAMVLKFLKPPSVPWRMYAERMHEDFRELVALAGRSPETIDAASASIAEENPYSPGHLLIRIFLPSLKAVRQAELRQRAGWTMLLAGLAVLDEGPKALKRPEFKNIEGGPLKYKKIPGGFRLESQEYQRFRRQLYFSTEPIPRKYRS